MNNVRRAHAIALGTALLIAACSDSGRSSSAQSAPSSTGIAAAIDDTSLAENDSTSGPALQGRTGTLTNPDATAMVFLYYDLAGIQPPIDQWVEQDRRVQWAAGIDKAARRTEVRAELEAGVESVRTVGFMQLSMNADLSEYDPTYEEFTVRALAPSSVVHFEALQHKVSITFTNARRAQIWHVPASQAQTIRDKLDRGGASLDVLLRLASIQPSGAGGTIAADVLEYEMRETRSGAVLARNRIAAQ